MVCCNSIQLPSLLKQGNHKLSFLPLAMDVLPYCLISTCLSNLHLLSVDDFPQTLRQKAVCEEFGGKSWRVSGRRRRNEWLCLGGWQVKELGAGSIPVKALKEITTRVSPLCFFSVQFCRYLNCGLSTWFFYSVVVLSGFAAMCT